MIVDIRVPTGSDPIGEWAGECARWLCLCEAQLQAHGATAAAPDPVARVIALRIDAGLPPVVDMAADPWPESAAAMVTWAAVRAHALTHRDARRALRAALAAGECVESERLCAAMGVSDE